MKAQRLLMFFLPFELCGPGMGLYAATTADVEEARDEIENYIRDRHNVLREFIEGQTKEVLQNGDRNFTTTENVWKSVENCCNRVMDNNDRLQELQDWLDLQADVSQSDSWTYRLESLKTVTNTINTNASSILSKLNAQIANTSGTWTNRLNDVQSRLMTLQNTANDIQTSITNQADATQTGTLAKQISDFQSIFNTFNTSFNSHMTGTTTAGTLAKMVYDTQTTLNNQIKTTTSGSLAANLDALQKELTKQTTTVTNGTLVYRVNDLQEKITTLQNNVMNASEESENKTIATRIKELSTQTQTQTTDTATNIQTAQDNIQDILVNATEKAAELTIATRITNAQTALQTSLENQAKTTVSGSLASQLQAFQNNFNTFKTTFNTQTTGTTTNGTLAKIAYDTQTTLNNQLKTETNGTLANRLNDLQTRSTTLQNTADTLQTTSDTIKSILVNANEEAENKTIATRMTELSDLLTRQATSLDTGTLAYRVNGVQSTADTIHTTTTNINNVLASSSERDVTIAKRISDFQELFATQVEDGQTEGTLANRLKTLQNDLTTQTTTLTEDGTLAKMVYDTQTTLNQQTDVEVTGSLAATLAALREDVADQTDILKGEVTNAQNTVLQAVQENHADLTVFETSTANFFRRYWPMLQPSTKKLIPSMLKL